MKNIKNIIIFLSVIFVILIIVILVCFNNKNKKPKDNGENAYVELSENVERVKNDSIYFTIESIVDMVIDRINQKDKDFIINTLNKDIIKEERLNEKNILAYVKKYNVQETFNIIDMYQKENSTSLKIYIKGKFICDNVKNNEENNYLLIRMDNVNSTFDFEFIKEDEFYNVISSSIKNEKISILKNEYNKFKLQNLSSKMIAGKYLSHYKSLLLNNNERAYELLDEEYKKKRFPTIEEFKQFIQENKEKIKNIYLNKYIKDSIDNKEIYICCDRYDNYYIFSVDTVMQYTVQLDSYTLDNKFFVETYNKKSNKEKAIINVQKFIEMINRNHFESAYNNISSGFKKQNLLNESNFDEFMKNIFYKSNKLYSVKVEEEGSYYVINTEILNEDDYTKSKKINFVVNLKENLDFELSFSKQ